MKIPTFTALTLVLALLPWDGGRAQSIHDLSLNEVLAVALKRSSIDGGAAKQEQYTSSSWLASLPSIGISYLSSDKQQGTDEAEISLNLPIKSASHRRIDKKLQALADEFEAISLQQKSLHLSGFIRESVWSHKVAVMQRESASRKMLLLSELEQQYQELFAAKTISEYSLLRVQKERFDAQINELEYQQEIQRWLEQFKVITGLGSVPVTITEDSLEVRDMPLHQHPQVRLLDLAWAQKQQMMLVSRNQSDPWNVSLTAKNVDSPNFQDEQFGIGVEIPLSFVDMSSELQQGEWQQERQGFDRARDELQLGLQHRWTMLLSEASVLQKRNELLRQSSELSERIAQQSKKFRALNEMGEEMVLRQLIDAVDAQSSFDLNKIYLQQNNAMLRQAAGISL